MTFNSFGFWMFYVCVIVVYYCMKRPGQNVLLLASSYFFYGCWDWRFLGLIIFSTLVDYWIGAKIAVVENESHRRGLLLASMSINLGCLGFFKYYNFFSGELDLLLTNVGIPGLLPTLDIILPVGISFYTFQTMSYTIDVYRGQIPPVRSLLDFAVFVSFFPQLVAGPIERASTFLPQVCQARVLTSARFKCGLYHVVLGMFLKVVMADNMAQIANAVFSTPAGEQSGLEILLGIYAFAFQIYGDFAGYSAIARGVANWLGFELSLNFQMPYLSVSPSDFWRRWHISLSGWLRDYLYIPLGGNRHGVWNTYRNLMLTMLLGGLWHGANWTFIAWGAIHGGLLCIHRYWTAGITGVNTKKLSLAGRAVRVVVMFQLICITWLLFRSESVLQAAQLGSRMFQDLSVTPLAISMLGLIVFYIAPLMLFEIWLEARKDLLQLLNCHWAIRGCVYLYACLMMMLFPAQLVSEFIYFQF